MILSSAAWFSKFEQLSAFLFDCWNLVKIGMRWSVICEYPSMISPRWLRLSPVGEAEGRGPATLDRVRPPTSQECAYRLVGAHPLNRAFWQEASAYAIGRMVAQNSCRNNSHSNSNIRWKAFIFDEFQRNLRTSCATRLWTRWERLRVSVMSHSQSERLFGSDGSWEKRLILAQ